MSLPAYLHHVLENLADMYSMILTLTPSAGKTAQDALMEVRCAVEEAYSTARSSKTDSRIPVARAFKAIAARCIVEASQLMARDEYEVLQWADPDKLAAEVAEPLRLSTPVGKTKHKTKAA